MIILEFYPSKSLSNEIHVTNSLDFPRFQIALQLATDNISWEADSIGVLKQQILEGRYTFNRHIPDILKALISKTVDPVE